MIRRVKRVCRFNRGKIEDLDGDAWRQHVVPLTPSRLFFEQPTPIQQRALANRSLPSCLHLHIKSQVTIRPGGDIQAR